MRALRRRVKSVPSYIWLGLMFVVAAGGASAQGVPAVHGWLGRGADPLAAGLAGLAGLLGAAAYIRAESEAERAKRLAAGLEAEAHLETARAIREVNRELDTGADRSAWTTWTPRAEQGPSQEEPPAAQETTAIAGAVDRFYADALLQSKVWFLASVLAALVGLAVIVWEVVQANGRPDLEAGLKAATGLLVEAVAALFYRQANATRKHAGDLLTSTQGDRRAETARQILSTIQDVERREEIAGRLALHLAGALPAVPRRRSAGPARNTRPDGAPVRRSEKVAAEPEE
jgi:hypothetical protein